MTHRNNDCIDSIETPAFVINDSVAQKNINKFQHHCVSAGLKLRPHIKTHKLNAMAQRQIDAGASGITCQKIGEAEVMANAGLKDILITFNIVGAAKLRRLRGLADKLDTLIVVADNQVVIEGLAAGFKGAAAPLKVMIECDTGAGRCGVQTPADALQLAMAVCSLPSLSFAGLMTYPAAGGAHAAADFMKATVTLLDNQNIDCPEVSTGGTPDMWQAQTHGIFTEYRIGTYIYNDRSLLARGTCKEEDCAGHVLATVVSRPTSTRVVIDAGSKVLTSDLFGLQGYGYVVGHPHATIDNLSEEHGVLSVPQDSKLAVGERIRIIPNHVCVVSNMFDTVWLDSAADGLHALAIDARGMVC